MIDRRAFATGATAAVVTGPGALAQAQPARQRRIAWITEAPHPFLAAFRNGLSDAGLAEPRDYVIVTHYADGDPRRLDEIARGFDGSAFDVVVASGGNGVEVTRNHVSAKPLFIITTGAVELGLVQSLSRPGRNIAGFDFAISEFAPKWLELMLELRPESRSVGLLFADSGETRSQVSAITAAASILRRDVFTVDAADGDFTGAFAEVLRRGASGAISLAHPPFAARRDILIQAAAAARIPVCFPNRVYTDDGGLMSYGPDFAAAFRRSGVLVARILRGQPIDTLPMERPTRFELVLNLRAARAQGIDVPLWIQQRADEVID